MNRKQTFMAALASCCALISAPALTDDFYENNDITFVVGTAAGGDYDFTARLVSRHLSRHIPGNPDIIVENRPGAASRNAANYVYNLAPQDGSVIAALLQTVAEAQAFNTQGIRYDAAGFQWIGSPTNSVNVFFVWHDHPVETIQEAYTAPVILGGTSRGSSDATEPLIANAVLGTRFNVITGYEGGNAVELAVEQGEVDGRAGISWDGLKSRRSHWVEDDLIRVLAQTGLQRADDLQDTPLLIDLADNDADRALLETISSSVAIGRPIVAGPDVPESRVAILRTAFDSMLEDPRFLEDAANIGFNVVPVTGEELETIVDRTLNTSPDIIERINGILSAN